MHTGGEDRVAKDGLGVEGWPQYTRGKVFHPPCVVGTFYRYMGERKP